SLFEHRCRRLHVLDMQTEVVDARRSLCVCGLQLHEGVFADLNIDERYLPFLISVPECLRKAHCLRVIRHRLIQVRNAQGDMVKADDSTVRTLSDNLDGQSDYDSRNKQNETAHKQLLSFARYTSGSRYCPLIESHP